MRDATGGFVGSPTYRFGAGAGLAAAALLGFAVRDEAAGAAALPDVRPLADVLRPLVLLLLGIAPRYGPGPTFPRNHAGEPSSVTYHRGRRTPLGLQGKSPFRGERIMSWSSWRIAAASIAITGVAAGFVVNIARGVRMDEDLSLVVGNYFSLFTIVSSIATIVVLLVAARRHGPLDTADGVESPALAIGLATTSTAMIILAIVYNAMLRGLPMTLATPDPTWVAFLDRWATETLHVVLPIYLVIDVIWAPRRRPLGWRALIAIVGIPMIWAVYTMLRGPFVDAPDGSTAYWYPYPFLDPNGPTGYATPLGYIGVIAAAFLLFGGVLVLLTHRHHHVPRAQRPAALEHRPHAHV